MMHQQFMATESWRQLRLLGYISINNQFEEMRIGRGPRNAHDSIQCSNGNGGVHQACSLLRCVIRVCISNDWSRSPVEVPFVPVYAEVVAPLVSSAASTRRIMSRNTLQVRMVSTIPDGTVKMTCKIGPTRMSPAMTAARSMKMRVTLEASETLSSDLGSRKKEGIVQIVKLTVLEKVAHHTGEAVPTDERYNSIVGCGSCMGYEPDGNRDEDAGVICQI